MDITIITEFAVVNYVVLIKIIIRPEYSNFI
jgi:hypothetical protein